jgi:2-oxoglutarate dehydrogenase E1 component
LRVAESAQAGESAQAAEWELASLLCGDNAPYVEGLYEDYLSGRAPVPETWRALFERVHGARANGGAAPARPSPALRIPAPAAALPARLEPGSLPRLGVFGLVNAYRSHGHLIADLDPLAQPDSSHPLLDPAEFGFDEASLDRPISIPSFHGMEQGTARQLLQALHETYCGTLAVEFMEMRDKERRDWLLERMEPCRNHPSLADGERVRILERVLQAERFEQFLHKRFLGKKRFSLEGGEALIPLLDALIEDGAELGAEEMVIAMAHRGRLNVLVHTMGMPYAPLLRDFQTGLLPTRAQGSGDVKYHRGYSSDRTTRSGGRIHLSLCANPSHLEAINPVAEGIVRCKQNLRSDLERVQVVPLLIHGDASFGGQGIVAETLVMSELDAYWTGGTIHVIVNNQIGFTTSPEQYSFTRYPSDVAKAIQAPVFHVNADDPEACVHAARLAIAFRQRFHEDVILDLVCYRRHGHNEGDDPTFTQPLLYKTIDRHPRVGALYSERLRSEGVIDAPELAKVERELKQRFEGALETSSQEAALETSPGWRGLWADMRFDGERIDRPTRVPRETLERIARTQREFPPDFHPHPKVKRLLEQRTAGTLGGGPLDWGTAEALAIGSLLVEGTTVRLTGEDVERGTFSHRHGVLIDVENGARLVPLEQLCAEGTRFIIANSPLSEAAVLGFEYGYSTVDPRRLTIWEAQYGDFANGAQIIIDQFVASAEQKWSRASGLVMLLPHGYEGSGPEHSSARLERFLQLCAQDNLQVVNLTTPAQFFHALRRQICRSYRKPLIVMSPKSLLRHKGCVSSLEELCEGGFAPVLDDPARIAGGLDPLAARRVLLCSGKLYYDLAQAREETAFDDVAIVRIEELHPFPFEALRAVLAGYATQDFVWAQEEPWNMGAWHYLRDRLGRVLPAGATLRYVGRAEAASPATGSFSEHEAEESELIREAFAKRASPPRSD